MSSTHVSKSFNRLHAALESCGDVEKDTQRLQREQEDEHILADVAAPATPEECIPWILEAWKGKDYFRWVCIQC
jgi:hypothetical protein